MGLETHIKWPIADGIHKAVQFLIGGQPYIRFGQQFCSNVTAEFAQEIEIKAVMEKSPDEHHIVVLHPKERYRIEGAGRCELWTVKSRRMAEFYGASFGYQMGINETHLELSKPFSEGVEMSFNNTRLK